MKFLRKGLFQVYILVAVSCPPSVFSPRKVILAQLAQSIAWIFLLMKDISKPENEEAGKRMREDVLNVLDMRDNNRAIDNIKEQIKAQQKKVDQAAKVVEQARIRLTDAMQERKIHEKLKENSFEDFKREINAAESKEIDELVSYTYGERIKKNNQSGNEQAVPADDEMEIVMAKEPLDPEVKKLKDDQKKFKEEQKNKPGSCNKIR